MRFWFMLAAALILAGCSSHRAPPPNPRLADSITVVANLNEQLRSWRGAPYRYGGMTPRGVDCSGFVVRTFRDKFALQLPRETREQAEIGTRIDKRDLLPGDLVFFKTGSGESGLHVGDGRVFQVAVGEVQLADRAFGVDRHRRECRRDADRQRPTRLLHRLPPVEERILGERDDSCRVTAVSRGN